VKKTCVLIFILFLCFFTAVYGSSEDGWETPLERADLLLFAAHADDEHLFFAGLLPYCVANGINAQVVYMNNHDDNPTRISEMLDGLLAVGIKNQPVIAPFPDLFSETLEEALNAYGRLGFTEEHFIDYCVENLRRFKPLVAVGHDVLGEYGHGGHMLSSHALIKAAELAADPSYHPESASKYGTWDTPKTYLNLWNEREIMLKIDEPLEYFDGQTAFQVSQHGFSFHKSQHWTYFNTWLNGTAAAPITSSGQIQRHNPSKYGLFRTTVGDDTADAADFFQNVTLLKDIEEEPEAPDTEEIIQDGPGPGTIIDKDESNNNTPAPLITIVNVIGVALILLLFVLIRRKNDRE